MDYDETAADAPAWAAEYNQRLDNDELVEAARIAKEVADNSPSQPNVKALALHYLGKAYFKAGELLLAKEAVEQAKVQLSKAPNPKAEAALRRLSAKVFLGLFRIQEAVEEADASLKLARQSGSKVHEGAAYLTLAKVAQVREKKQEAQKVAKQAVVTFREVADKAGELAALKALAKIYIAIRKPQEALKIAAEAVALFEGVKDPEGQVTAFLLSADANVAAGQYEVAQKEAQKAVEIWENAVEKVKQARALNRLAKACFAGGNTIDGWQYAKEALQLYRDAKNKRGEITAICDIALAHLEAETYEEAVRIAEEGVSICRDSPDRPLLAKALFTAAKASVIQVTTVVLPEVKEQQVNWRARLAGKEALAIFQQIGDRKGEADALNVLATAFLGYGNVAEAKAKGKQAVEISKEIGDKKGEGENLLLVAQSRVHDNREEATRLARVAERLLREASGGKIAKRTSDVLDHLRDWDSYKREEKRETKPAAGPAGGGAFSMEKTDVVLDFENMSLRAAYFHGFTSRAARSRTMG